MLDDHIENSLCHGRNLHLPDVLRVRIVRLRWPVSAQVSHVLGVQKTLVLIDPGEELIQDFVLVHLHFDEALRLSGIQLVLLNGLDDLMNACRSFLTHVVELLTLDNLMQTTHNGGLDH